ncbi:MAG: DUF1269 domain-containing protein [Acidimicrobiales bacterium]
MNSELVLLHFDSAEAAEQTLATVRSLEAQGFLELEDAGVITRADDGAVTLTPRSGDAEFAKPTAGAVLGLVAGSIVGIPILGAMAIGGVAAKKSVEERVRELDTLLSTVAQRVQAGSTALVLAVAALPDPETVADRLSIHRDDMTRVDIPPELRAEIDAQKPTE